MCYRPEKHQHSWEFTSVTHTWNDLPFLEIWNFSSRGFWLKLGEKIAWYFIVTAG